MAVKYREDESINFNPNLPAGLIQVGSAGAGGEALSQGLETFKPQTTETATILPQTTFQPIAGVGQATSNIFENIQKRFGPTGASPRGDFETDIFRNVIDPDDEDEDAEDEQDLIDEFGLVTPDLDFDPSGRSDPNSPNYDPTPIPELKEGQVGYKTLKKFNNALDNFFEKAGSKPSDSVPEEIFDLLGALGPNTSTGGGGRGATSPFVDNKIFDADTGFTGKGGAPTGNPTGTFAFNSQSSSPGNPFGVGNFQGIDVDITPEPPGLSTDFEGGGDQAALDSFISSNFNFD